MTTVNREAAIETAFSFVMDYRADAEAEINARADRGGDPNLETALSAVMNVLPEVRSAMKRVTARKWGGDDAYSWAVFLDGRPGYTGLSQSSTRYYRKLVVLRVLLGGQS